MKRKPAILVLTDKRSISDILRFVLGHDYDVTCITGRQTHRRCFTTDCADCILLDSEVQDVKPLKLLKKLNQTKPSLPVIGVVTARARGLAEKVMRVGAYDTVHLPQEIERIPSSVRNAIEWAAKDREIGHHDNNRKKKIE